MRGQLAILLPQPEIRYAFTGEAGYMFPRADGILLGGTFERDEWEPTPAARRRSPGSSPRTSSCSPASAAPLELAPSRLQSRAAMTYQTSFPAIGPGASERRERRDR